MIPQKIKDVGSRALDRLAEASTHSALAGVLGVAGTTAPPLYKTILWGWGLAHAIAAVLLKEGS